MLLRGRADMPRTGPPTIFFSAGEPSGDLHGANLIRQLQAQRPGLRGGRLRRAADGRGRLPVARRPDGLGRDVVRPRAVEPAQVLDLASRADRYFRHHRPDAVVLIDYPGFNWWIARRAKAHGIPVFYYAPPQIWAWARWRVKKMRRLVDHVLCSLPFEEAWFRRQGCNATFVGHPFFDEVRRQPTTRRSSRRIRNQAGPLVAILPGSRTQEVAHNLQWFLKAPRRRFARRVPEARFAIACVQAAPGRNRPAGGGRGGLPVEVCVGQDARIDAAGRLLHGGFRLGFAGAAVSDQADGDPLLDQPTGLFRSSIFPESQIHHAGEPAGERRAGSRKGGGGDRERGRQGDEDARRQKEDRRYVRFCISLSPPLPPLPLFSLPDRSPRSPLSRVPYLRGQIGGDCPSGDRLAHRAGKRQERVAALAALKAQVAHGGASRRAAEYILAAIGLLPFLGNFQGQQVELALEVA